MEHQATVRCDHCNKTFPWQPEMSGQRVRCVCGHVFVPRPLGVETDDYDLAPEIAAPARPVEAVKETHVLQYEQRKQTNAASEMLEKSSQLRNLWLPIGLAMVGIGLRVAQFFLPGFSAESTLMAVGAIALALILNVILMFCAVVLAAQFIDADFGSVNTAIIKLTGTAIIGGAVAGFVGSLDWGFGLQGPILALHAMLLVYCILFYMLFEMDLQETVLTVCIVMFFQIAAFCLVFHRYKV